MTKALIAVASAALLTVPLVAKASIPPGIAEYNACVKVERKLAAKRWRAGEITSQQFADFDHTQNCRINMPADPYADVTSFDECEAVYNQIKLAPNQGYPCDKYRETWDITNDHLGTPRYKVTCESSTYKTSTGYRTTTTCW